MEKRAIATQTNLTERPSRLALILEEADEQASSLALLSTVNNDGFCRFVGKALYCNTASLHMRFHGSAGYTRLPIRMPTRISVSMQAFELLTRSCGQEVID